MPDHTDNELVVTTFCVWRKKSAMKIPTPNGIFEDDINDWETENPNEDRSDIKLHQLSKSEEALFDSAKVKEIEHWSDTGKVSKIFRNQLNEEQMLRCRWMFVWKPKKK